MPGLIAVKIPVAISNLPYSDRVGKSTVEKPKDSPGVASGLIQFLTAKTLEVLLLLDINVAICSCNSCIIIKILNQ